MITAGDLGCPDFGIKSAFTFLTPQVGKTRGCCDFLSLARVGPVWPITRALCLLVFHLACFRKYFANLVNYS